MLYKVFWLIRGVLYKFFFKKIGILSYIGTPIFLKGTKGITIGKKVRIFPGIRMETHNKGQIIIENDVSIGQNFHITSSGSILTVKSKTTISGNVFITNIDHEYQNIGVHILKQNHKIQDTIIGENCFIGYGCAIQAGTILGKHCVVGANSVVRGKYPDYCVLVGAPAKIVKKYNMETNMWCKTDIKGNFINEK